MRLRWSDIKILALMLAIAAGMLAHAAVEHGAFG